MIVLVAVAALALAGPSKVVIANVPPSPGDRWTATASISSRLHVGFMTADVPSSEEGAMDEDVDDRDRFEVIVLDVSPAGATRVRVTYTEKSSRSKAAFFGASTRDLPVAGRSFVAEAQAGSIAVVDAAGESASPLDAAIVARDVAWLGGPMPIRRALLDRALEVGETFVLGFEESRLLLGDVRLLGQSVPPSRVVLELSGTRDEGNEACAVFLVQARLSGRCRGDDTLVLDRALDLSGELLVSLARGRLVKLALRGTTSVETAPGSEILSVKGAGTLEIERAESPLPREDVR